jgi:hypothetical protein
MKVAESLVCWSACGEHSQHSLKCSFVTLCGGEQFIPFAESLRGWDTLLNPSRAILSGDCEQFGFRRDFGGDQFVQAWCVWVHAFAYNFATWSA